MNLDTFLHFNSREYPNFYQKIKVIPGKWGGGKKKKKKKNKVTLYTSTKSQKMSHLTYLIFKFH